MARRKKKATKTKTAAAKSEGAGKRLSDAQKQAIVDDGKKDMTLKAIGEAHGVSIPTVRRLIGSRRGGEVAAARKPGRPESSGAAKAIGKTSMDDVTVSFSGDRITISLPRTKTALVKSLLGDLI